jgi:hypothetical protein
MVLGYVVRRGLGRGEIKGQSCSKDNEIHEFRYLLQLAFLSVAFALNDICYRQQMDHASVAGLQYTCIHRCLDQFHLGPEMWMLGFLV